MNQRAIDVGEAIVRHEEALAEYLRLMGELGAEEARMRDVLNGLRLVGVKASSGRPVLPQLKSRQELEGLIDRIDAAAGKKESAELALKALGLGIGEWMKAEAR